MSATTSKKTDSASLSANQPSRKKSSPLTSKEATEASVSLKRAETLKEELEKTKRQLEKEKQKTSEIKEEIDQVASKNNEELQKLKSEIQLLRQEVGMTATSTQTTLKSSSANSIPSSKKANNEETDGELATKPTRSSLAFRDDIGTNAPKTKRSKDDLELNLTRAKASQDESLSGSLSSERRESVSSAPSSASTKRRTKLGRQSSDEPSPQTILEKSRSTAAVPRTRKNVRSTSVKETPSHIRRKKGITDVQSTNSASSGHRKQLSNEGSTNKSSPTSPETPHRSTSHLTPKINSIRGSHNALWLLARQTVTDKEAGGVHSDDEADTVHDAHQFDEGRRKSTADSPEDTIAIRSIRKKIESKSRKASNRDILSSVRQSTGTVRVIGASSSKGSSVKIADSNNFAPSASTAAVAGATGTVEAVSPSPTIFPSSSSSSPPPSSPPPPPPSLNEGQQPAQVGKLEKANTTIIPKRLDSPSLDFNVKKRLVLQKDQSTGTLSIRGATVSELVRQLVIHSTSDIDRARYTQTFLLTYQSFTTPVDFFKRLAEHFMKPEDKGVQKRVVDLLFQWLEDRYQDFFSGEDEVSLHLQTFITTQISVVFPEEAAKLNLVLDEKRLLFRKRFKKQIEKVPTAPKRTAIKDLLAYKHAAIAVELTYQISELFQRIEPLEFLQKPKKSPNSHLNELIQKFNQVSAWIQTEIVKVDQLNKRAKLLIHIIKVALDCQEIHNYDSAAAIVSALQSAAIYRLKQTWAKAEEEKPKLLQNYRSLEALISSEENYKLYRQLIVNVKPPAIPYIGVLLKDITFINDGNPDTLEQDFGKPNFINFNKREKLANVILEIRKFQQTPYGGKRDKYLQALIESPEMLDENQIWELSQAIEAKQQQQQAKKK